MSFKPRLPILSTAGVALTMLVLTAACSKTTSGGGTPPTTSPTSTTTNPTTGATEAPPPVGFHRDHKTEPVKVRTVHRNRRGELDSTSGRSQQEPVTHSDDSTATTTVASDSTGFAKTIYDTLGMNPDQIFAATALQGEAPLGIVAERLSGREGNSIYYSGSGQDDLRSQISALTKASDSGFAKTVSHASFAVQGRQVHVSLLISNDDAGRGSRVQFVGTMDDSGVVRAKSELGKERLSMEAACMDTAGTCSTMHIIVRAGDHVAHVLARDTQARLFAEGTGFGVGNNPEYDRLLEIIKNTEADRKGSGKFVKRLHLITSETVNGSSQFRIEMLLGTGGDSEQDLKWSGDLVKAKGTDGILMPIHLAKSPLVVGDQKLNISGTIGDSIRQTLLERNDGRGNLQIELSIPGSSAGALEHRMLLTISRLHAPVNSPFLKAP